MCQRTQYSIAALALAVCVLAESATAYYSPRQGRFISRDPIGEEGFALVGATLPLDNPASTTLSSESRVIPSLVSSTVTLASHYSLRELELQDVESPQDVLMSALTDSVAGHTGSSSAGHMQTEQNLYLYARSSPVSNVDFLGLRCCLVNYEAGCGQDPFPIKSAAPPCSPALIAVVLCGNPAPAPPNPIRTCACDGPPGLSCYRGRCHTGLQQCQRCIVCRDLWIWRFQKPGTPRYHWINTIVSRSSCKP